ncbi:MAG: hypothetical protein KGI06_06020 [Candidatus Micrarchaeota archaeon]|nr:hypothetical protein [Candidatus Micrarchaeota archaeon]
MDAAYLAGKRSAAEAMRERAVQVCEDYASAKWSEYKRGTGKGRANPQLQGESDGADDCAEAIRALGVVDE